MLSDQTETKDPFAFAGEGEGPQQGEVLNVEGCMWNVSTSSCARVRVCAIEIILILWYWYQEDLLNEGGGAEAYECELRRLPLAVGLGPWGLLSLEGTAVWFVVENVEPVHVPCEHMRIFLLLLPRSEEGVEV